VTCPNAVSRPGVAVRPSGLRVVKERCSVSVLRLLGLSAIVSSNELIGGC
jgi:hypothetical protein